jgi:hypothetical protein
MTKESKKEQGNAGAFEATIKSELGGKAGAVFAANALAAPESFRRAGRMWGALLPHFAEWAGGKARYAIRLMQRDCEPLRAITGWRDMFLTRKICGIADELAGCSGPGQRLLTEYIRQETGGGAFTMIDSGCWGSIVLSLSASGIKLQPLFFFSRNPHIESFLGDNMAAGAMRKLMPGKEIGEFSGALNDTYECCIPKRLKSPGRLVKRGGKIGPLLEPNDNLSVRFSGEFEEGLKDAPRASLAGALEPFAEEYRLAKQGKSAIMTGGSPPWSKGPEFLKAFRAAGFERRQKLFRENGIIALKKASSCQR